MGLSETGSCAVKRTGVLAGLIAGEALPSSRVRHSDEQYRLDVSARSNLQQQTYPLQGK